MFVQLEPMEDKGTIGDGGSGKERGKRGGVLLSSSEISINCV